MKSDPHTDENGLYPIHSIYFDNYHNKALREKIDGVRKREKYRIRWYNDIKDILTFEKKTKINNLCMKFGRKITRNEYEMILSYDYNFLMDSGNDILQEFYYRLTSEQLRPTVQVSYVREPYIYEQGITFDSKIKSSLAYHDWNYDSPMISATDYPDQIVMEVKYDSYLPSINIFPSCPRSTFKVENSKKNENYHTENWRYRWNREQCFLLEQAVCYSNKYVERITR